MNEIVESIQKNILSPEIPLSPILLKAKLLAHKLKNDSFKQWVKHEVDGYPDYEEVPDYRVIHTPLLGYIFSDNSHRQVRATVAGASNTHELELLFHRLGIP